MPITLDRFRIEHDPESLDPANANFSRGEPRNADWQASDADAIGTYPVHTRWTVVDGRTTMTCGQPPSLSTPRHFPVILTVTFRNSPSSGRGTS